MMYKQIWQEYQDGIAYKNNLDLYEQVKENEDYYNGKQWGDLVLKHIEQPTLNVIKPITNLYVALLISDDIALNTELFNEPDAERRELIPKILKNATENVLEVANIRYHNRRAIRNAVLDGDACMHFYFDPSIETGEAVSGEICAELLDNTNVYFGDTSSSDVQSQPYIILAYRKLVSVAKKEVEAKGIDPDIIKPDSDDHLYVNVDKDVDSKFTTILRKLWRDSKTDTIWCSESVEGGFIKEPFDLGYKRYPIAWMSWEERKNSYHGVSPVTAVIPNQQYINKMYAMGMQFTKMYAFPKVAYDAMKVPGGWNNDIGKAIAVNGNPRDSVLFDTIGAGQFNSQAIELAEKTITQTKELMGASDAALGNVRPDNTSAIIAVQKAANMPLDIQRLVFFNFVEECVRNIVDIMRVNYGPRSYVITADNSEEQTGTFDYRALDNINYKLQIDIGQGSYWSELMQVQTLDALQNAGLIPDPVTYYECAPEGYIKNKQQIIDKWKALQGAQAPTAPVGGMPTDTGVVAAEEIANNPLTADISDEDLAELLAELKQAPPEKQQQLISMLNVSDETKNIITQMLDGGMQNGMS